MGRRPSIRVAEWGAIAEALVQDCDVHRRCGEFASSRKFFIACARRGKAGWCCCEPRSCGI